MSGTYIGGEQTYLTLIERTSQAPSMRSHVGLVTKRGSVVVAADVPSSLTRKWAGFEVQHDLERRLFAGVLLENVPLPPDNWYAIMNPTNGQGVFLGNVGHGRVRAYLGYPKDAHRRFQRAEDIPRLIEESVRTGAAADLYAHAQAVGPLATFGSDDSWVEHSYKEGVALIGDAASTCDPSLVRDWL
jgi:2-polyprenyl-6-methoxyphenol hydroxylase-like FAD-dependent oxidoreductase